MNLFTKQTPRYKKQAYGHQRGRSRERKKFGVWD